MTVLLQPHLRLSRESRSLLCAKQLTAATPYLSRRKPSAAFRRHATRRKPAKLLKVPGVVRDDRQSPPRAPTSYQHKQP